jgi:hypothetical protein
MVVVVTLIQKSITKYLSTVKTEESKILSIIKTIYMLDLVFFDKFQSF